MDLENEKKQLANELARDMQQSLDALFAESIELEKNERERDDPYGGSELDKMKAEYRRGMVYALQKMKRVLLVYKQKYGKFD
ncbi:MAG: hypothetical protein HQM11_16885 [SAR324 cluster bacterium]|nr:hypothetical protein [SAR324 cluster bacterium]